jgi:GxxExxY protein
MEKNINQITHTIIGYAMRIHSELGSCYNEVIYQRALALEFNQLGLQYKRKLSMPIIYLNENIGTRRIDFLVNDSVIVEIKVRPQIDFMTKYQLINYLEIYNVAHGLLINFGSSSLQFNRLYNKKMNSTNKL